MFSAVYNLSPVSIHILILALMMSSMTVYTSSCSLSYTAVAPHRNSPSSKDLICDYFESGPEEAAYLSFGSPASIILRFTDS